MPIGRAQARRSRRFLGGLALLLVCGAAGAAFFAYQGSRALPTAGKEADRSPPLREKSRAINHKQQALFVASSMGNAEEVSALLRAGVDPSFRTDEGSSPLGVAIANDHREVVRLLLAAGVDPNAAALRDQPALLVATLRERTLLIEQLTRAGASPDFVHPTLGSALMVAIGRKDAATIEAVLSTKASLELRNAGGARAIHFAALVGNKEVTQRLMDKGSSIHCPNFQGGTPLRAAASEGHADIVRLLLAAGADPSTVDLFGKKPVDYAREGGHQMVVEMLEKARPIAPEKHACPIESPLAVTLPPRGDATLNAIRQVKEKGNSLREMSRPTVLAIEAPSMIAAIRQVAGPSFGLDIMEISDPDPRLPLRPVGLVLWTYERSGKLTREATPAVPRPEEDLIQLVGRLAEYPYALPIWSRIAALMANQLRDQDLRPLLSVMVYPPATPATIEPWDWSLRVQVAAALIASHLAGPARAESPSLSLLKDLMDGPADWSNTAAIIALFDVARRDEAARPAVVRDLLRTARRRITPPAYQHAIKPAALALLDIPQVSAEVVGEMTEIVRKDALPASPPKFQPWAPRPDTDVR